MSPQRNEDDSSSATFFSVQLIKWATIAAALFYSVGSAILGRDILEAILSFCLNVVRQ